MNQRRESRNWREVGWWNLAAVAPFFSDLRDAAQQLPGLCWYPSCGDQGLRTVMGMSPSVYLFSDFGVEFDEFASGFEGEGSPFFWVHRGEDLGSFRLGEKRGFYFRMDNRAVFDILRVTRLRLTHFVGLNDGCCEGGNDACVHDEPFLGRLLARAASPLCYITDHSLLLKRQPWSPYGYGADAPFSLLYYRDQLDFRSWRFTLKNLLVIPCLSNDPEATPRSRREMKFQPDDIELLSKDHGQRRPARQIHPDTWGPEAHDLASLWSLRYTHGRMAQYTVTRKDAV
jgi:hypothetical protein